MQIWGVRLFFIIVSAASCYIIYRDPLLVLIGLIAALLLVGAELCLYLSATRSIIASVIGLSVGLLIPIGVLRLFPAVDVKLKIVIILGIGYVGLMSGYWLATTANLSGLLTSDHTYPAR